MADSQDILSPEERVEAYLRRQMTPEEEISFEAELRSDPDLMQLLDEHLIDMAQSQWVGMNEQAQQFDSMFEAAQFDYSQARKVRIRNGLIVGGVVAAAVIAGAIYLLRPEEEPKPEPTPPTPQELYENVYQLPAFIPADTSLKAESTEMETLFGMVEDADSLFQAGSFPQATQAYDGVPIEFLPASEQARILYLKAVAAIEAGQASDANIAFKEAQEIGVPVLTQKIQWYQSLLYLNQGETDSVRIILDAILQNSQHPFYNQAQGLLAQIDAGP